MTDTLDDTLMSDVTTQGARVGANAFFLPDESTPEDREYVFGYRIVILNNSQQTVPLQTRHWDLIDGEGELREVDGQGVVGQTPTLGPGEAFKYHSFAVLPTPWGTMEGTYTFRSEADGSNFKANIGRFYLTQQSVQHTRADQPDTSEAGND